MDTQTFQKVRDCLADTLKRPAAAIEPDCSIIDDLGAESIDLLDLTFRLAKTFGVKLKDAELYAGDLNLAGRGLLTNGKVSSEGIAAIRERMPGFDLSRFSGGTIFSGDLPRLITPRTLVHYLDKRLAGGA